MTLSKAGPRGGKYYKRVRVGDQWRYFYTKSSYEKHMRSKGEEPHLDGSRAASERVPSKSAVTVLEAGERLAPPDGDWTLNGKPVDVGAYINENYKKHGHEIKLLYYAMGGDSIVLGKDKLQRTNTKKLRRSESEMDVFDQLLKAEKSGGGWEAIPNGKKGGQRRRKAGGGYQYRYDVPEYKMSVTSDTDEGARSGAEKTKSGIEKSADICKVTPPVCSGNLGIERKDMPQFDTDANPNVIEEYLASFKREGVKVVDKKMAVGQLKATQKEINADKVKGMAAAHEAFLAGEGKWSPGKAPIVVSSDGYVLDGHHRWAAMLDHDPSNEMPVHQVDAPIKELLARSEQFHREGRGVKKADFGASSIGVKKSMTAGDAFVYASWYERICKAYDEAQERIADPFDRLMKAPPRVTQLHPAATDVTQQTRQRPPAGRQQVSPTPASDRINKRVEHEYRNTVQAEQQRTQDSASSTAGIRNEANRLRGRMKGKIVGPSDSKIVGPSDAVPSRMTGKKKKKRSKELEILKAMGTKMDEFDALLMKAKYTSRKRGPNGKYVYTYDDKKKPSKKKEGKKDPSFESWAMTGGVFDRSVKKSMTMDEAFAATQREEYAFKVRGGNALAAGPEMVSLRDDSIDPFVALKKSHDSQPDGLGRRFVLDQDRLVVPTIDADCMIHGMRDLTKSMNLSNPYTQCSCPKR